MKNRFHKAAFAATLVVATLMLLMQHAEAKTVTLVKRPDWMSRSLPQSMVCPQHGSAANYIGMGLDPKVPWYECRMPGMVDNRLSTMILTDGQRTWVENKRNYVAGFCMNGACYVKSTHELIGFSESPKKIGFFVTKGHYIMVKGGKVTTHAFGTGPMGQQFLPYAIQNEEKAQPQPASSPTNDPGVHSDVPGIKEVWCNPQANYCTVTTDQGSKNYSRDQLPGILPMAKVKTENGPDHYCDLETCNDKDDNFIGLNPFYYQN